MLDWQSDLELFLLSQPFSAAIFIFDSVWQVQSKLAKIIKNRWGKRLDLASKCSLPRTVLKWRPPIASTLHSS